MNRWAHCNSIDTAWDKGMDQWFYWFRIERLTDRAELTQLVETLAADCRNVLVKSQLVKSAEIKPSKRALTVALIVYFPICIRCIICIRARVETVRLEATQITSDLSEVILSRLVAIHLSTTAILDQHVQFSIFRPNPSLAVVVSYSSVANPIHTAECDAT